MAENLEMSEISFAPDMQIPNGPMFATKVEKINKALIGGKKVSIGAVIRLSNSPTALNVFLILRCSYLTVNKRFFLSFHLNGGYLAQKPAAEWQLLEPFILSFAATSVRQKQNRTFHSTGITGSHEEQADLGMCIFWLYMIDFGSNDKLLVTIMLHISFQV